MGLTRPTVAQLNTVVTEISDPISVLNKGSTLANVDVGFVFNRDGGISSNVAFYWNETADSLIAAYTTSTGGVNSNIDITSYANLTVGNITSAGNISAQYIIGNGQFLSSLPGYVYSNINVAAYLSTSSYLTSTSANLTNYAYASNVTTANTAMKGYVDDSVTTANIGMKGYVDADTTAWTANAYQQQALIGNLIASGYSNVNAKAYTETMGFTNYSNVNVAAYTQTQNYTNYSNVNLSAYLGGAVTIGGNLTVDGNLFVNGNTTTINTNNLSVSDSLIYLATTNPGDTLDIGFIGHFINPGYQHTGFVRDATDGVWKLFANVVAEPTTTVDFTNANYSSLYVGNIQTAASANIGSTLNVVGNVLGSIGTFSALTVGGFINTSGNISGARVTSAGGVFTGEVYTGELYISTIGGNEGGQINLGPAVTNTTLVGNVVIDVYQNRLRIWESGGTNRGGYFDISTLSAGVGTNLVGGGTPGGGNGQLQFNSGGTFAGAASLYYFGANGAIVANAGIASTSTSTGTFQVTGGVGVTGNVTADLFNSVNNGNGTNFKVGDDIWLGDINIANTLGIKGQQDGTQGYIRFGNVNTNALGVNGSGPLSWGGALNITGNVTVGNIFPTANNVSNIGSATSKFRILHAQATQAQYADLAEVYTSDQQYPAGTVVVFGGDAEVTQSRASHDTRIAGVVSTNPAYLMNSTETGVPVALQGRVPCRVLGPVSQGDRVVSSHIAGVAQALDPLHYQPGCIIGKALQAIDSADISIIEVVVGRV